MSAGALAGASAASAAAAQESARRREEEERLTTYQKEDLTEGWEFKIIRSSFGFKGDKLQRLCEEEAQNGWQLLEKFDETRVRFKRPIIARENDRYATIDPYRTTFEDNTGKVMAIIIGVMLATFVLIFGIAYHLIGQ